MRNDTSEKNDLWPSKTDHHTFIMGNMNFGYLYYVFWEFSITALVRAYVSIWVYSIYPFQCYFLPRERVFWWIDFGKKNLLRIGRLSLCHIMSLFSSTGFHCVRTALIRLYSHQIIHSIRMVGGSMKQGQWKAKDGLYRKLSTRFARAAQKRIMFPITLKRILWQNCEEQESDAHNKALLVSR